MNQELADAMNNFDDVLQQKDDEGADEKEEDASSSDDDDDDDDADGDKDDIQRAGEMTDGFILGNYTSEDMVSLKMITQEMNRRIEMARGMKRGRKVQGFSEYCLKTTERIKELKDILKDPNTEEEKKKQLRNQVSAFQARLKQRITNMDQELRLEQKNQQLSTIL